VQLPGFAPASLRANLGRGGWLRRTALLALIVGGTAEAQEPSSQQALRARVERLEAVAAQTSDPAVQFLLAEAYAEAGDRDGVLRMLHALASRRAHLHPEPGSALARFGSDPEVGALLSAIRSGLLVVRRARVMTILDRPKFVPEGVAYDPGGKRLLIGDMAGREILAVDLNGRVRPFATGLSLRPLGMKVREGRLWVAATNAFWDERPPQAEIWVFDVATRRRVAVHRHPEAKSFNDLDFSPAGDLYVTDSAGGSVFRLKAGDAAMERLLPPGALSYPNGVAVSGDGRSVYVAQGLGPTRIDPITLEYKLLAKPEDLATIGIDGLYWREGALIAVQNAGDAPRLLRLPLDAEGRRITNHEVLEAGGPHLTSPSTATFAADRLYVIANAQVRRLRGDGSIEPSLAPVVVLETPAPHADP
jgi:DNA-binding beta-propeller fold protein YncE